MTNAEKNKIAPFSIFCLLFVGRVSLSLTYIQSVSANVLAGDMLISIVLAMAFSVILALPVIFCCKKNKNPFDIKWLGILYALYFVFTAAVNVSRFAYFASTTLNPDARAWMFGLIMVLAATYAAYLGIEGIARFSSFALIFFMIAALSVIFCNLYDFNEINLYPVIVNKPVTIAKNTFLLTTNSIEIIMFLCLTKRVNGNAVKQMVFSILASFLTLFILIYILLAVMGDSASMKPFPLFTFFQLARIGNIERIDAFQISFWLFAVFLKVGLLIYCASISVKALKQKNKCIVFGLATFIIALVLSKTIIAVGISPLILGVVFLVFSVLIPLLTLIFKKRNRGDELIEKF